MMSIFRQYVLSVFPALRMLRNIATVCVLLVFSGKLYGQWSGDVTKRMVQDTGAPTEVISVPVVNEGFYLVWKDEADTRQWLKFAFYNPSGAVQIRADGKSATFMMGKKEFISAHKTLYNHLMILWKETDPIEGDYVYAQRVTPTGQLLYGDKGKLLCGPLKDVYGFSAEVNDSGDSFIAYSLKEELHKIYLQRVGIYEEATNNKTKSVFESNKAKHLLSLSAMPNGGMFLSWIEEDKIFTQYIERNGEMPWGELPKQITASVDNIVSFRTLPVADSVLYYCYQTLIRKGAGKMKNLAHTAVTTTGSFYWKERPVQMISSKGNPSLPQLALASDSSILISYLFDNSSPHGSMVQKIERRTGKLLWGISGKPVEKRKSGIHQLTRITSDTKGGALVAWFQLIKGERATSGKDPLLKKNEDKLFVYMQRLNRRGEMMWDSSGKQISTGDEKNKSYLNLFSDGSGGGVCLFVETTKYGGSIYGKRVFSNGSTISRFTEFSHTLSTDSLTLYWRPLENIRIERFLIERKIQSDDDEDADTLWTEASFIRADVINPVMRYSYVIVLPETGEYTYRIGGVSAAGDTVYTDAKTIHYRFDEITGEEDLYNYPNPFADKTTIYFTLVQPVPVKFEFYNTSMEKFYEKRIERTFAGKNGYEFNAEGLKSGIYFYKMIIGKYAIVRKFLVAK